MNLKDGDDDYSFQGEVHMINSGHFGEQCDGMNDDSFQQISVVPYVNEEEEQEDQDRRKSIFDQLSSNCSSEEYDNVPSLHQVSCYTPPIVQQQEHNSLLDLSYHSQYLPKLESDVKSPNQSIARIKVIKCQCKKKGFCQQLYCSCFKNNRSCTNLCKCLNCKNVEDDSQQQRKLSTSVEQRKSCKCKKTQCLKGYCECKLASMKCNSSCQCLDCKNTNQQNDRVIPQIKKRIKKYSHRYKKGQFIRTNRKKVEVMQ